MPRLFTGIEIPPAVATGLSACRGGLPGARWIDPDCYHITLRFIGDIDDRVAREVHAALSEARPRPEIPIAVDGLDTFGGEKPRAVFARIAPTPGLIDLHGEHERLMRHIGLAPEERKFTPHVTLARLRGASPLAVAEYLATRGDLPQHSFTATRVALYSATDSVGGGPYIVEAAYPLG
ncbi:RNA 2',3'-cyclic phosphodiesterase [Microvirga antarctica]|uniref:RNA 2',3'-cyclic phosphodiesterase n=1 Tax=Microvirga antarctica TaxID=2819233 RepID=UPI001B30272A|nr:RNA 2',3'-cyclic phosphodiesterase [Microvirga antarctica]